MLTIPILTLDPSRSRHLNPEADQKTHVTGLSSNPPKSNTSHGHIYTGQNHSSSNRRDPSHQQHSSSPARHRLHPSYKAPPHQGTYSSNPAEDADVEDLSMMSSGRINESTTSLPRLSLHPKHQSHNLLVVLTMCMWKREILNIPKYVDDLFLIFYKKNSEWCWIEKIIIIFIYSHIIFRVITIALNE